MPEPIIVQHLMSSAASDVPWKPFREGIEIHTLYERGENGPSAALLRYQPGARVSTHMHTGFEHILILSGSQVDARGEHVAGTLVINPPGSVHDVLSPNGCTVLAIWERPVEFIGHEA
jgi:anti-sigma factor ChrR (cupin superfamily)